MMPVGKDGRLHVYHDQVVRAIHDNQYCPPEGRDTELRMRVYGNTPYAVLLCPQYESNL
jgi:hypothetical protein